MCSSKECAAYFKEQKVWQRCFKEFRKKWNSYGKAAGKITLEKSTEEERRAVGGILGRVFYEETFSFSFAEFEKGLQKTRFGPVDMKDVLEAYFGAPLPGARERRQRDEDRKRQFFQRLCRSFEEAFGKDSSPFSWISSLASEKKHGYQLLVREYGKDEKQAEFLACTVGRAVAGLERLAEAGEECPLAVFASGISENPHYFDRGTAAGQLFVHGICYCEKMEVPENAHQWRNLLLRVLIVPDNVSSMVHCCGLRLFTDQGPHPAYDAFFKRKEPCVITMENMKGIVGVQAAETVFIVENEMVFSYLLQNLKRTGYTLLCTSGQPRAAARVLIPMLLSGGSRIYYNGDMDPDGICIADRLWQKYGDGFHIWRMSPEDYEASISKEAIGAAGLAKLGKTAHPVLRRTAERIREKKFAGYQENILQELVRDMEQPGPPKP